MQRLRRVFDIDPSYCPRGGAQLRVIAAITEPALIATVLQHLAMRVEHGRGARAPQTAPLQQSPQLASGQRWCEFARAGGRARGQGG